MDPITHAVLGSACSQALLYPYDKRNAWIVGGLAAMAPDLDIFIRESGNPMLFFLYHRYFTHSLIFIPIGALLVTAALCIFTRFRAQIKLTFLAALIGYATHGLLDACTSYGTVLFWPFSETRVSWDIVSIVDPWVTIPLTLGLVWFLVFHNRQGIILSLVLIACFFSFNILQHQRALSVVDKELQQLQLKAQQVRVIPKLLSSTAWRGISTSNNRLYVIDAYTPLYAYSKAQYLANYPLLSTQEVPQYVKNSPSLNQDLNLFNWFSNNYLILVNNYPLVVADGRFLVDDNVTLALWGMEFSPKQKHAKELSFVNLK